LPAAADLKRPLVEPENPHLSIRRKCQLLGLSRSTYYLGPATASEDDLRLMRLIDQQFLRTPFYGSRRMTAFLERSGETVNRKRVRRLMALMGLEAVHPQPRTTTAAPDARAYPYLLRDRVLTHPDEVWSSDITYVPMRRGFMYLTAVIDWFSRYVLSWRLSNTLDGRFCLEALDEALAISRPEIFNTDEGSQFMAREYTGRLEEAGIAVSRDGRGRALDNVFVERLWRSVKKDPTAARALHIRSRCEYNRVRDCLPLGFAGSGPLVPGSALFPRRICNMPRHPSAVAPPRA
jgi:putative transposase